MAFGTDPLPLSDLLPLSRSHLAVNGNDTGIAPWGTNASLLTLNLRDPPIDPLSGDPRRGWEKALLPLCLLSCRNSVRRSPSRGAVLMYLPLIATLIAA